MRLPLLALLLVTILPEAIGAQACVPSRPLRVDTTETTLGIVVRALGEDPVDMMATAQLGDALRRRVTIPATISRIFYPGTQYPGGVTLENDPRRTPVLRLTVWLSGSGRIDSLERTIPSVDPETDSLLIRAMREMADDGTLARLAGNAHLGFTLELVRMIEGIIGEPLVKVRVPFTQLDTGVRLLSADPPVYPRSLLNSRIMGRVLLRYVVGEDGRAEPSTIRIIAMGDPAFGRSAIAAIESARFTPASAGGCPAKAQVQQTIRFTIGKP